MISQNIYSVNKLISKSVSGTSGTSSVSGTSGTSGTSSLSSIFCDITEDELKMYGIKCIYLLSDEYGRKLFIDHLDIKKYSYDVTTSDINIIIKQHINKYCIREIRKEKLEKIVNKNGRN